MLFGGFFLMALFGAIANLLRSRHESADISPNLHRWDRAYLVTTVVLGWLAVLSGAYIVYPWYRAIAPAGAALTQYPQRLLLASPTTAGWHNFGMEWKEHVAWFAPIAMTAVAYIVITYRNVWQANRQLRRSVITFAAAAFLAAAMAGTFGALINKAAPVEGGRTIQLIGETK